MKQRYYLPFLAHPMTLRTLSKSWLTIFLSVIPYITMTFGGPSNPSTTFNIVRNIFKIFLIFGLFSFITHFIKKITYKFQIACFVLLAINFLILLMELEFILFIMLTEENVYSWYNLFYIIVILTTTIVSSAYYGYCYKIKKECVLGFKDRKWEKQNSRLSNFGIIFGFSLISPYILIGYIEIGFVLLAGLLFSVLFTGLIVDSFYAAYLIHKDPEYKETR